MQSRNTAGIFQPFSHYLVEALVSLSIRILPRTSGTISRRLRSTGQVVVSNSIVVLLVLQTIDSLPPELLSEILEYHDILNVPSGVFALSEVSISARFGKIEDIWLEVGCLKRLIRIARHPVTSKYVTKLRFTVDRLDKISACEYLRSQWDSRHDYSTRDPPDILAFSNFNALAVASAASVDSMALNFVKYVAQLQVQAKMEESEEGVRFLTLALGTFLNIKAITVDNTTISAHFHP